MYYCSRGNCQLAARHEWFGQLAGFCSILGLTDCRASMSLGWYGNSDMWTNRPRSNGNTKRTAYLSCICMQSKPTVVSALVPYPNIYKSSKHTKHIKMQIKTNSRLALHANLRQICSHFLPKWIFACNPFSCRNDETSHANSLGGTISEIEKKEEEIWLVLTLVTVSIATLSLLGLYSSWANKFIEWKIYRSLRVSGIIRSWANTLSGGIL